MPTKIDKVIVTNFTALKAKYGAAGVKKIQTGVKALIAADKKRGLTTRLFGLDRAPDMKKVNASVVTSAANPKQNKAAVDAIYNSLAPDYLMILGAIDVVPHQDLKSPTFSPPDEPDEYAFGDIPYACETQYSQNPQDFFGPTRVVGRLPDISGGNDPQYLVGLLKRAAKYKSGNAADYRAYFGISAEIWQESTALSLTNTFGDSSAMKTVPKSKPSWPASSLGKLSHFINCHGASRNQHFFGQPASGARLYPTALDAAYLEKKISEGTVAAAECCYGGQLYNPHANHGPICNTYLGNRAFGFFGSTTIAYGPADGNDQADLICQFFLQSVLQGASLGRAALEARQKFVHKTSMSDPSNVKTIAQFNLYGDPSLVPVSTAHALAPGGAKALAAGGAKALATVSPARRVSPFALRVERAERRRDLFSRGLALAKSQPMIYPVVVSAGKAVNTSVEKAIRASKLVATNTLTFEIKEPPAAAGMPKAMMATKLAPDRVHMVFTKPADHDGQKSPAEAEQFEVIPTIALIIKEVKGEVISATKIYAK